MGSDIFAPWHIIILLVVVLVLFGAKRLPGAAQSLGQSMHIFRRSVKGLDEDSQANPTTTAAATWPAGTAPAAPAAPAAITPSAPPADATQQQIADLQRQLDDLQRRPAADDGTMVNGVPLSEAQRRQQ